MSALVLVMIAATAQADAVGPPPEDCPAGSVPRTDHAGPHCLALDCDSDADCPTDEGYECAARPLCIEHQAGVQGVGEQAFERDVAHSFCADDGACDRGACDRGKRCVRPSLSTHVARGCGCGVGGPDAPPGLALLTAIALFVVRRRVGRVP